MRCAASCRSDSLISRSRWAELIEGAPHELTSFLYGFAQRDRSPVVRLVNVYAGVDVEAGVEMLTPLFEIGPLLGQLAGARASAGRLIP